MATWAPKQMNKLCTHLRQMNMNVAELMKGGEVQLYVVYGTGKERERRQRILVEYIRQLYNDVLYDLYQNVHCFT